ncbi:cellulose biosynthesis protein BcsN [Devosia sp. Naph2]|uniref:cellulose biosynthesis protein BcsN n=1 Tax=Devosia polycyclovorans TaxID=3345148 RepID=UPI0035CF6A8E
MLALSPGAGAILSIVQTGYNNATEQMIMLDTTSRAPGQNYFKVQMFEAVAHSSTPGGLQDVPLANLDLAGEARGTVNYADMKLSPYFVQNLYGPFGYSMGRTATGDLCMYAWQRVAPDRSPGGGVRRGAINLRALICHRNRSEAELLEIMYQLRIKGVTGVAKPAPAEIGAYGRVIMPTGPNGVANVLPDPPRPARSTAPASPTPSQPTLPSAAPVSPGPVPPPMAEQVQGPVVPPPRD